MLQKRADGLRYALIGLTVAWREEANFKIEVACAVLALALGLLLHISLSEFAVVTLVISFVFTAEAFNTALEELCDKFQPTHDPHIGKIKDLAAAAVLLASVGALIVGLFIFVPHL